MYINNNCHYQKLCVQYLTNKITQLELSGLTQKHVIEQLKKNEVALGTKVSELESVIQNYTLLSLSLLSHYHTTNETNISDVSSLRVLRKIRHFLIIV